MHKNHQAECWLILSGEEKMPKDNIVLYGPDNQPIRKKELTKEIAAPSLTGVRNVWNGESVASGLTPDRLASVLRNAIEGDHREYLVLAEEMEEREPHYASVLGTRKRAISGLPVSVESASDDAEHVKHADEVRELIRKPEFGILIDELLDGLGKGYSACEILWNRSSQWTPRDYPWRDPRFFMFDREGGRELRLIDEGNAFDGVPLEPYKFIVHIPKLKSGLPIRGGLARLAAVSYMCKSYTLADWMAFAEVFGMPLRVGRYGPGATKDDINTLINAVANIGSDAAAVLPASMRIEFEEGGNSTGGQDLFLKLAEWLDKQTSKAILGQTASTEGTPGKLGGDDAQNEVRKDILCADAKQLEHTLNRDLVKPFIDLNFGPQENYPRIQFLIIEPEDLNALSTALEKLVPLGLGVQASWARDKFGIPDPEKDAELLGQTTQPAPPTEKANNQAQHCPSCATALNREEADTDDAIDDLIELDDWQEQLEPIVDPVLKLADEVDSYEEFIERLPELLKDMDSTELIKRLATETFKARGLGDATDKV